MAALVGRNTREPSWKKKFESYKTINFQNSWKELFSSNKWQQYLECCIFRQLFKNGFSWYGYFKVLLETIHCIMILLNRKRHGELQRLLFYTYHSCVAQQESSRYKELDTIVIPIEKSLLKNFRMVMRSKRGRSVAILYSKDVQEYIDVILSVLKNVVDEQNPYLFGNLDC